VWVAVAHHLPDRTRLHCPSVRRDDAACERLAEALAQVAGVREVKVRPYTASALVLHGEEVALEALTAAAQRVTGCDRVVAQGEAPPRATEAPPLSSLAYEMAQAGRSIDEAIRRASQGAVDLGTLATLGFLGAGAAEVIASRRLPMPPWFNLAWWGFRTFMTAEREEIDAARDQRKPVSAAP
jgi:heavy-metal-associated domain-containing protein